MCVDVAGGHCVTCKTLPTYMMVVNMHVCMVCVATGYIHRLRGYHGLGEETYYHSNNALLKARHEKSIGHGFSREWRYGWTDDGGEGI